MAVLQVVPHFIAGGAEALALSIHQNLLQQGLPSFLLSLSGPPVEVPFCTALGASGPRSPSAFWLLRRWLKCHGSGVRVIHTHLFSDQLWTPLALKGLALDPILITSLHSAITGRDTLPCGVTLDRGLYRPYRRLICVSAQVAEACSRRLPDLQSRLQVIPNGVDLAAFRPWQGSAPQDPPKIVVVGRLSAEKNHAFLLRVLAELDEVPLTLWIVGAGPEERRLKALVERLSLKNRVKFYGYCTDITEILSYSDIHVMPTRSEGFGLVAAEAMAAGLPSVVTDLPVLREVLGEEGFSAFFAPLNDRTVFVAQLRRLLLDPALRRRMGNQALKAARKHDRAQMHKAYTDLYRSLGAY